MELNFVILIILFLLPGYVSMIFINLLSHIPNKKSQIDQILQYFLYSLIDYLVVVSIVLVSIIFTNASFLEELMTPILMGDQIYIFVLFILALVISPFVGVLLGQGYFAKGYPHKHFEKSNHNLNFSSVYSYINETKGKCWIKCKMKDDVVVSGAFYYLDKDEDKRSYILGLTKVKKKIPNKKVVKFNENELVVINLDNTKYIKVIDSKV